MNVLIVGTGRMGERHAEGVLACDFVEELVLCDRSSHALEKVQKKLSNPNKIKIRTLTDQELIQSKENFPVAILATTADARLEQISFLIEKGIQRLLIEKPVAQSQNHFEQIQNLLKEKTLVAEVNHPYRLFSFYKKLKNDLNSLPQLIGPKTMIISSGAMGIACNGIHQIDLLFFLLNAARAELRHAEIEANLLKSSRGENFKDFGGSALLQYFDYQNKHLGKAYISITNYSSAYGGWDIMAPNGRILIDEKLKKQTLYLRNKKSDLPLALYGKEYDSPQYIDFDLEPLSECSRQWLVAVRQDEIILPTIEQSKQVHQILFDWLGKNKDFKDLLPIT